MAYDDHVDEMHRGAATRPEVRPFLPATTAEKARRVDHALRTERDTLRRNGGATTREGVMQHLGVANSLVAFLNNADEAIKARLFDLIVGNETKDAALQSLEDAGFRQGHPGRGDADPMPLRPTSLSPERVHALNMMRAGRPVPESDRVANIRPEVYTAPETPEETAWLDHLRATRPRPTRPFIR